MRASSLVFGLAILAGACSALTGVDKYDVNDCPRGNCSEAGASSSSGGDGARDDAASDAASSADTTADTVACPGGTSLVTLTLTGAADSVNAQPGGVIVPPNPGSLCIAVGQVRLRASNNRGTWNCVSGCAGSAQDTDTFNFQNPPAGSAITANLSP